MDYCYHTTKLKNLGSILKSGLQPIYGDNSYLTADSRTGKISYSAGIQAAVYTFSNFNYYYNATLDGAIHEEEFKRVLSPEDYSKHQKSVKEIQESKSFDEWIKDNVYLCFDKNCVSDRHEKNPEDSYTTEPISPKELKVCVIKNKSDDLFKSFSMKDIYCFLHAKNPELEEDLAMYHYKEDIEKFKDDNFYIDYMSLEQFCELYPELVTDDRSQSNQPDIRENSENIIKELYDNEDVSIGIHGTAVLPDKEQKHEKSILENGLMCRYGDLRRTVSFQDRGKIHAHGNISLKELTSYTYNKHKIGYLYEEKKIDGVTSWETKTINLEQCSFIIAIPKEMSTIDDNLFSGPWQGFEKEFAEDKTDLRLGGYKENKGRPLNTKYILGYYMNGDISNFVYNSKFYALEYDKNGQPYLNTDKLQIENEKIRQINESRTKKDTQELGKETIEEQKDTSSKNTIKNLINTLTDKLKNKLKGRE